MGLVYPYELANGNTADADEVMANFDHIKNNLDTDTVDDASANNTEMQSTADPYPGDTESLATDLRGELKRLRYLVKQITGKSQWYIDPDTNLLLEFNKGADIASANALALGTDGNYFDVTGTTAITSINTRRVGSVIKLHFDGILTFTHHATDLILPGAVDITTAAGDEAELVEYATGDWRLTNFSSAAGLTTDITHAHVGGDGAVIPVGGLKVAQGAWSIFDAISGTVRVTVSEYTHNVGVRNNCAGASGYEDVTATVESYVQGTAGNDTGEIWKLKVVYVRVAGSGSTTKYMYWNYHDA